MEIIAIIVQLLVSISPLILGIVWSIKHRYEDKRIEKYSPMFEEQLDEMDKYIRYFQKIYQEDLNDLFDDAYYNYKESIFTRLKIFEIGIRSFSYDNSEESIKKRYNGRQEILDSFVLKHRDILKPHYREKRLKKLLD